MYLCYEGEKTMNKKIEIYLGFEIDANEDWELTQNIDNLLFAIKQGRYNTTTPNKTNDRRCQRKSNTHEMT